MDDCLQAAGNDLTDNMCAEKKRRKRSSYKHNILGAMGTDEPEFKLILPKTPKLVNFGELDVRFIVLSTHTTHTTHILLMFFYFLYILFFTTKLISNSDEPLVQSIISFKKRIWITFKNIVVLDFNL